LSGKFKIVEVEVHASGNGRAGQRMLGVWLEDDVLKSLEDTALCMDLKGAATLARRLIYEFLGQTEGA
jgi:hypothetical protein